MALASQPRGAAEVLEVRRLEAEIARRAQGQAPSSAAAAAALVAMEYSEEENEEEPWLPAPRAGDSEEDEVLTPDQLEAKARRMEARLRKLAWRKLETDALQLLTDRLGARAKVLPDHSLQLNSTLCHQILYARFLCCYAAP